MNKKLFLCGAALVAILATEQAVKAEEVTEAQSTPTVELVEKVQPIESTLSQAPQAPESAKVEAASADKLGSVTEEKAPEDKKGPDDKKAEETKVQESSEAEAKPTTNEDKVSEPAASQEAKEDAKKEANEEAKQADKKEKEDKGYTGFKSRGEAAQYHQVKSGDSLWAIANLYKITLDELLKYNNFSSLSTMIHPGDKLVVKPGKPATSTPSNDNNSASGSNNYTPDTTHTIQSGDSLWLLSQRYGVTLDDLVKWNGFSSYRDMIHPGQQIIVKKGSGNSGKATPAPAKPQPTTPSTLDARRQKVIEVAKKYLGVPYVYGGKTPSGFDCSGFVGYVFKEALGIDITTWTVTQERKGTEVAIKDAKPGDLFFYGPRGGTEHVSIYLGGKQYIHAPYPGQVVKIADMTYYMPSFARRIIQ